MFPKPTAKAKTSAKDVLQRRKHATTAETMLAKVKPCFRNRNVAGKGKPRLPSEHAATKGENAISERKRRLQRVKSFHPAKTSLPNATTRTRSENVARQGEITFVLAETSRKTEIVFTEHKRRMKNVFIE